MNRSTIDRAAIRMFFTEKKNTAQIARILDIPEANVDRIVARELDRRWKAS